ncbi:MAG: hypothetical protein JST75_06420 [Bacteroidetes bacterium]|nr:hypothetical protein [Bacteroidota bacterium]
MKRFLLFPVIIFLISSCNKGPIVSASFADSLINAYSIQNISRSNDLEMQFWKNRMESQPEGFINEQKYANTLLTRYKMSGDINDVKEADSIVVKTNERFRKTESAISLKLAGYSIMQHKFKEARAYMQHAKETGSRKYPLLLTAFDVYFESGDYDSAAMMLKMIRGNMDYNYQFRLSKMEHLKGAVDSSIHAMLKAASLAESDDYLKQVALSNAADLYVHAGELKKANNLYVECIRLNPADFHSIMALGWIALVHDHNDSLAEKIFSFAHAALKSPDPLLKLAQLAGARNDSSKQKKYANEFVSQATKPVYGNMYNKYLIELYTTVLNNPSKAEDLAKKELDNRSTPQTYAWYAWSLFSNDKTKEAYQVYKSHVSGKPLEGLELYWMGKLMKGIGRGYDAQQFFEAAYKNKYDFTPSTIRDLEKDLE